MDENRFQIWQINPTQCGIRDTKKHRNIVFSENHKRLRKVVDVLNELDKENQLIKIQKNNISNSDIEKVKNENNELKKVLKNILISISLKQNRYCEIKVSVPPYDYELLKEILIKYEGKRWDIDNME